jgi:2-polyprenyl-6-methoxyphenol hydroxylase-like FAD-dependent oxidoreductase
MSKGTDTTVLIVGAGPTGLALACDLARREVSFRIIDKADKYFAGSRGKGLQPRSLEVLDDLGVIGKVLESGRFHLPFRGYEGAKVLGDRDIHEGRVPTPDVPYASSLIIPQWRVEEILRNRLQELGGHVELATELIAFEQDAEIVTAKLSRAGGSELVTSRYLIGADGGRSLVRRALNVGFEGETWSSERMLVGDVRVDSLDRDHWHSWPNSELGWVALCPLPGTESFQFQAQIGPDEPDEPSLERFQQIIDERTGGLGLRLYDATWLSLYRANVRMVDRYRIGRVFLAGDAAHVHSPAGDQGMNTGIQDAHNLGWKLGCVMKGAPDALLDTYEAERLPVAAWMLGVTTKLHRTALQADSKDHRRGPETLQLGITYRDGLLARDERRVPGNVRAGGRAPDAPCHDAAGKPIRLFDIFRGPHFTLLVFDPDNGVVLAEVAQLCEGAVRVCEIIRPGESGGNDAVIDTEGHAYQAYDVQRNGVVLVRPDGYIGLIADGLSADPLHAYLRFAYAGSGSV